MHLFLIPPFPRGTTFIDKQEISPCTSKQSFVIRRRFDQVAQVIIRSRLTEKELTSHFHNLSEKKSAKKSVC